MNEVRLSLTSVIAIAAIVGAAAFAAGRSMSPAASSSHEPEAVARDPNEAPGAADHPATGMGVEQGAPEKLPAGHPPVDTMSPPMGGPGSAPAAPAALVWKAPARWQLVPSTSSMRLATYRIPRVQGDPADPELSIIAAGGSVEANADRWVGQFDAEGQKTAKRSTRKVGGLDVTVVEVEGTFSGGMGPAAGPSAGWALLGAIVPTAETLYFFKMTGPAKSVAAAHAEFDAFVGHLAPPDAGAGKGAPF